MIRILLLLPNPNDGTSFYRALGVFAALRKKHPEFLYEVSLAQDRLDWSTISQFDLFFLQRPYSDTHLYNAQMIKKMKKPYIVDYDDNFHAVPVDNLFYETYANPHIRFAIENILANADAVWVTTEPLKNAYSKFSDKITVIPNALDDTLFNLNDAHFCTEPKVSVMWRGGNTHFGDLAYYRDAITKVVKETGVEITFYGQQTDFGDMPHTWVPFKNVIDYYRQLAARKHQICIVPLQPNEFNLCKSNCSWIEATYAGAVVLAPDFKEFMKPNIFNYDSKETFYRELMQMILHPEFKNRALEFEWKLNKNYIQDNLLLTEVNDLRAESIEKLSDF